MKVKKNKLSDDLRRIINDCGMSRNELCRQAGIDPAALCRFMQGQVGITVATLEAMADVLDLKLVAKQGDGKKR